MPQNGFEAPKTATKAIYLDRYEEDGPLKGWLRKMVAEGPLL